MRIIFYGSIPCARSLTKDEVEVAYEKDTGLVIVEEFDVVVSTLLKYQGLSYVITVRSPGAKIQRMLSITLLY